MNERDARREAHPTSGMNGRTDLLCRDLAGELGADGLSVSVYGQVGAGELVHATDQVSVALEEIQFTLGEGPALDCFRTGVAVSVDDLGSRAAGERWPGFSGEAVRAGAVGLLALPLLAGSINFGVIEAHRIVAGAPEPGPDLNDLLATLVDVLLAGFDDERADAWAAAFKASRRRPDVSLATGILSVRLNMSVDDALSRLRAIAYAENRPVQEVASDVVSGQRRFDGGAGT